MALRFEVQDRGGDRVVMADKATVKVGDRVLIDRFTGVLERNEVLGFIGPNGAGKSTLLKTLLGSHPLSAGELRIGASIDAAWYRQDMSQVPLDATLYDIIAELRPTWERRMVQGHLGRFGFSGDEVQRRAGTLSGGERARVALAMLMLSRSNLLILDEPTNHLDVESIEALEDALERYEGTVILVSHDRELLRALTTRVWVLHERHITDYDGNFAEWETVSAEREHAASVRASEEERLRKVRERQKLAQSRREPGKDAPRNSKALTRDLRRAQRALEEQEQTIAMLEARIAEIGATLDNPDLYTKPEGLKDAKRLGTELERLKTELDQVMERWSTTSDEVETLGRSLAASET